MPVIIYGRNFRWHWAYRNSFSYIAVVMAGMPRSTQDKRSDQPKGGRSDMSSSSLEDNKHKASYL